LKLEWLFLSIETGVAVFEHFISTCNHKYNLYLDLQLHGRAFLMWVISATFNDFGVAELLRIKSIKIFYNQLVIDFISYWHMDCNLKRIL